GADAGLVRLAKSSLAVQPADRPRNAGVLAAEMAAYRESMEDRLRQVELAQAQARARAEEGRKRRRGRAALAGRGLPAVLLVGGGVFLLVRARQARETQGRLLRAREEEEADRQMARRLREAILSGTTFSKEEQSEEGPFVRAYEEAFEQYGIPV